MYCIKITYTVSGNDNTNVNHNTYAKRQVRLTSKFEKYY